MDWCQHMDDMFGMFKKNYRVGRRVPWLTAILECDGALPQNPHVTHEYATSKTRELPVFLDKIQMNPNFTWDECAELDMFKRMKATPSQSAASFNIHTTWGLITWNPNPYADRPECTTARLQHEWDHEGLSRNTNITWENIKSTIHKPWDFQLLSMNPIITWKIVEENPEFAWDYDYLSFNRNITIDIIEDNFGNPWNFDWFSFNPSVTWKVVQDHPDFPWNYTCMSRNPNITWDIVQANRHLPWNYKYMSANKNITWEIVSSNRNLPWDFKQLSSNININWTIVRENPQERWDYKAVACNPMCDLDDPFGLVYRNRLPKTIAKATQNLATFKEELMKVAWNPDRIQRMISRNPGQHWSHELKAYTELDFNSMADIL